MSDMKDCKYHTVTVITALLLVFTLSACSAGQANVSNPQQQQLFASAPGSPVAVACGPDNLVVGDLNNDRQPDLVVAL